MNNDKKECEIQIINTNSNFNGNVFGHNGVIINNYGKAAENDLQLFTGIGEKRLKQLEPESKEYAQLSTAIAYAKREDREKLSTFLRKHTIEFWRDVFSSFTASGILLAIEKLMS